MASKFHGIFGVAEFEVAKAQGVEMCTNTKGPRQVPLPRHYTERCA